MDNPPTLEEQLAQSRADLASAQSAVAERDTARSELASAQAEVTRLTEQFGALTEAASAARADVTRLTGELATATSERDTARNSLTLANANLGRLETLCGVRGIDPSQAVPASAENSNTGSQGEALYKQWQELRKTDTAKAQSFFREHSAALEAYGESQRG